MSARRVFAWAIQVGEGLWVHSFGLSRLPTQAITFTDRDEAAKYMADHVGKPTATIVPLISQADATAETAKLRALLVEARETLCIAADRPLQVSEMVAAGRLEERIIDALAETEGAP